MVISFFSLATPAQAEPIDISGLHISPACRPARAPVLCAIKRQHVFTNIWRARAGSVKLHLGWGAYKYPTKRAYFLWVWRHRNAKAEAFYHSLWTWFRTSGGSCIHSKESVDWHEAGSPGGGMQFMIGTWNNFVARGYEFAPSPAQASPTEQIRVTRRVVRHDGGWREWSTHALCGL